MRSLHENLKQNVECVRSMPDVNLFLVQFEYIGEFGNVIQMRIFHYRCMLDRSMIGNSSSFKPNHAYFKLVQASFKLIFL